MAASSSSATSHHHHAQIEPADQGGDATALHFWPSFRRNSSLSSSPSFSSSNSSSTGSFPFPEIDSPFSPCRTPLTKFSGVPFSWEQVPGKPKNGVAKKEELSTLSLLLPLPPPAGSCSNNSSFRKSNSKEELLPMENMMNISPKKYSYDPNESFTKDPFFAALVECSKDDLHRRGGGGGGGDVVISKYRKGSPPSSKVAAKTLSDRFGFITMVAPCKESCAVSESIVFLPRSRLYNLINRR